MSLWLNRSGLSAITFGVDIYSPEELAGLAPEGLEKSFPSAWEKMVGVAEGVVRHLARFYKLETDLPQVRFFDSPGFEAYASDTKGIMVSISIITRCVDIEIRLGNAMVKKTNGKYEPWFGIVPCAALAWVTAHEFFHLTRGHFQFARRDRKYLHALEFDADQLATAGTFRYLWDRKPGYQGGGEIEMKKYLATGIFWSIQSNFGSSISAVEASSSHPAWYFRVFSCLVKLAGVGHQTGKDWIHTEALQKEHNELIMHVANLERMNLEVIECVHQPTKGRAYSPFFAYRLAENAPFDAEMSRISTLWLEIRDEVEKIQLLQALKPPDPSPPTDSESFPSTPLGSPPLSVGSLCPPDALDSA